MNDAENELIECLYNDINWSEAREFIKSIYKYLDEDGNVDPAKKAQFMSIIEEEDAKIAVWYQNSPTLD